MNIDNTQDAAEPSLASAGSQPVAWAVIPSTVLAGRAWRVTLDREEAEQLSCGAMLVVPLYEQPQPTLTDAEREAIEWALEEGVWSYGDPEDWTKAERLRAFLRGLLERTK
jgi:hypothetical protein